MPQPRKNLIDLSTTPFYHCICSCVRHAFLCGEDKLSGKSFEHRRSWLVSYFKYLSQYFAVEICAYAVMSNHYHLVLKANRDKALCWSEDEVMQRWATLYKGSREIVEHYQSNQLSDTQKLMMQADVDKWRHRLYDISWFMKNLNEHIAKQANAEDGCTGHFWKARFKSQALLDDTAVLSCMMYVDLNPIRANMADNLASSDFTAIQDRLKTLGRALQQNTDSVKPDLHPLPFQPESLLPFNSALFSDAIHFSLLDYLELIDWTARLIKPNKKGYISKRKPQIMSLLNINDAAWAELTQNFQHKFASFAGTTASLYQHAQQHGMQRHTGVGNTVG